MVWQVSTSFSFNSSCWVWVPFTTPPHYTITLILTVWGVQIVDIIFSTLLALVKFILIWILVHPTRLLVLILPDNFSVAGNIKLRRARSGYICELLLNSKFRMFIRKSKGHPPRAICKWMLCSSSRKTSRNSTNVYIPVAIYMFLRNFQMHFIKLGWLKWQKYSKEACTCQPTLHGVTYTYIFVGRTNYFVTSGCYSKNHKGT